MSTTPPITQKPPFHHIPPSERLGMTLVQAAEYCGIDRETLRPYVDRGEIAVRWQGRRRIIDRKSLEAWWRAGLTTGGGK